MKNIFVFAIVVAYGSTAFAESDFNPMYTQKSPVPASTTPASTSAAATRESGVPASTGSVPVMNSSINPAAQQGKESQSGGSGSNAAAGAALMAAGAALLPNPPTMAQGAMLMAMGMMAMMQSKEDDKAAGQSAATGGASNTNGGTTTTTPVDGTGTSAFVDKKIKEGTAKLGEAGYKVTSKGLTTPDGTFIPAKSFDSPSSMAAAGMTPSSIAAAQAAMDGATLDPGAINGARVSAVGLNTGAGGAGAGGGMTEGDSNGSSESGTGSSNPFHLGDKEKGSLVAGKTVMFDGEPIGVRGQNIFDMVHNCYQKKVDGKHFIEGEHDVATRMPASVKPTKK